MLFLTIILDNYIGLIKFASRPSGLSGLTNNNNSLISALNGLSAGGATAIGDAIMVAYGSLKDLDGRRTIVLLTDGMENTGEYSAAYASSL